MNELYAVLKTTDNILLHIHLAAREPQVNLYKQRCVSYENNVRSDPSYIDS